MRSGLSRRGFRGTGSVRRRIAKSNDGWEVVALHRATSFVSGVQFQGRLAGWVNEGTQILAILDYLKANHPSLYKEITGGD